LLPKDAVKNYIKAGRIASEVRENVRNRIKEDASLLDICNWVENTIKKKGGNLAFPCNICINDVAAHYSPSINDETVVPHGAIVKIDLGVHVDGYIADTATTVCLNHQYDGMVYAINEALKQAIIAVKPGTKNSHIGSVIQKTIERYGFKPIWNLSGHQMTRFVLHTGKSIPNVSTLGLSKIQEGEVFAIEPFLTLRSGKGEVTNLKRICIYRFHKTLRNLNKDATELQEVIKKQFKSLPFSKRWLNELGTHLSLSTEGREKAFSETLTRKGLIGYPVLKERSGNIVAQAEHTVIVTKNGCLVTTL
jgi:methionyl aminopeptidase